METLSSTAVCLPVSTASSFLLLLLLLILQFFAFLAEKEGEKRFGDAEEEEASPEVETARTTTITTVKYQTLATAAITSTAKARLCASRRLQLLLGHSTHCAWLHPLTCTHALPTVYSYYSVAVLQCDCRCWHANRVHIWHQHFARVQAGSAVQSVCLLHCSSFCRHCRQPALLSAEASSSLSAVCAPVACGSQSVSRFSWFSSPLTDGAQSAARLLALLVFKIVVCVFSHVC